MIGMFFDRLHVERKKWRQRREERHIRNLRIHEDILLKRDADERAEIARVFNDRYCTAERYDKSSNADVPGDTGYYGLATKVGFRWMCPTCNQIHAPLRFSFFVGLIYPTCCEHHEGSRNDSLGKLGTLKRPLGMCGPKGLYIKLLRANLERRPSDIGK